MSGGEHRRHRAGSSAEEDLRGKPRVQSDSDLYNKTLAVLTTGDPIGLIRDGAPPDEYSPEAGTILPRLVGAASLDELREIVHQEFARWFGAKVAGEKTRYERIAIDLWFILHPTHS